MHALEVENLTKTYANGLAALKGIHLTVPEGDFFALLGKNGAGKSTTIGILCSLVNKTAGKVRVFGHDMDTALEAAKSCIGVVPQEFNFNMFERVIDIIVNQAGFYGIDRQLALERAEYYLIQLGLWDKRFHVSRTLSGGMKRRLMIARALIHHPKMLILDEPTAGVDIDLRRSMWSFLTQLNQQGTTIILTTHYLEEAESLCRNIAIIDKGLIVENTSMKDLLSQLGNETIVLDLKQPLKEVSAILGCKTLLIDEHTLEITFSKSLSLNKIFLELSQQNIEVVSMRNKTNRLEELFLRLVHQENISEHGTAN